MQQRRTMRIFVSYSHKDTPWLRRIQTVFEPLVRNSGVDLWADDRISPGLAWRDELAGALRSAKLALLLVSPDYLASPFIAENELPPLLDAAKSRGLSIFWISVSASLYKETPLVHFQAANDPSRPLDSLPRHKVRERYA